MRYNSRYAKQDSDQSTISAPCSRFIKPPSKEDLTHMRRKEAAAVPPQVEQFSEEVDRVFFETITNEVQSYPDIRVLDEAVGVFDESFGLGDG
jgi:hypothetical protein